MKSCFCCRLYGVSIPSVTREYAFSGSLCCIREFEIMDGSRYCLTIFSLADYKTLHFPHDEYKILMRKLSEHLSTQTIAASKKSNDCRLSVEQLPFNGDYKIKIGIWNMAIGTLTAFGLLKTMPFTNVIDNSVTCDSKWDICACKSCPVFQRLKDFETAANEYIAYRKPENIIFFE